MLIIIFNSNNYYRFYSFLFLINILLNTDIILFQSIISNLNLMLNIYIDITYKSINNIIYIYIYIYIYIGLHCYNITNKKKGML